MFLKKYAYISKYFSKILSYYLEEMHKKKIHAFSF